MVTLPRRAEFVLPEKLALRNIESLLGTVFSYRAAPSQRLSRTIFDSFDWRLYAEGGLAELTRNDAATRFGWFALDGAAQLGPVTVAQPPCFAEDLPPGLLRRCLAGPLAMRALIPQIEINSESETLDLLNAEQKTVVRITIDRNPTVRRGKSRPHPLEGRLRFEPVKGYTTEFEQAVRIARDALGLAEAGDDLVHAALARSGCVPGDPSRLNVRLDRRMHAEAATRQILTRLLDTIEINEAGTSADIDSEFLHDFRVAVRRTRSALTQIKDVLPDDVVQRYGAEFKWLGGVTGPTRDMDVYLLKFDGYQASLPKIQRTELEPLRGFLESHQKIEQGTLRQALASARYRDLKRNWRSLLDTTPESDAMPANAARPIIDIASKRIWKVYRRVNKEGRAIGPDSPASSLHELRITGKKLRYLMEFFKSLYPEKDIRRLIDALKGLQDNLGDFQDLEVQAIALKGFGQQMIDEGHVPIDTLFAMGTLIANLQERQNRERGNFAARFKAFSDKKNRALFKKLFDVRRS